MNNRRASRPRVSAVVPLFDEEDSIDLLHTELSAALGKFAAEYEIVLVDDGSRDSTWKRVKAIAERDRCVTSIRFARNYGQTAAIQAGFDRAAGEYVVTLDGDLQNDPADVPRLLAELDQGYDVVSGWRKDRKDRLISRRVPSVLANWLIGKITGVRIHDNGCTLKAYRSEIVKRAHLYADMHRFLAPMLSLSGCSYKEIVVNHRPRRFGQTKYGLSRIWKVILDLLTVKMILRFIAHPAIWFVLLGLPFLLAMTATAAVSFYQYLTPQQGQALIVVPSITLLLGFAATNLLTVGMLAELVVRFGDYKETDPIVTTVEQARSRPE